jgi:hypothetical protein
MTTLSLVVVLLLGTANAEPLPSKLSLPRTGTAMKQALN